MENYLQAKLALLHTPDLAFVVVNLDDVYNAQILAAVPDTVQVWGVTHTNASAQVDEHITADNIHNTSTGIEFDVRWRGEICSVAIPLYGDFNVENVLCVLAVMLALGVSLPEATKKLAHLQSVTGRMERFGGGEQPLIFVDYAHTPDALDKVLGSVRKHCSQDLWVVFGCGGNRDTGKRPQMGGCAEQWADHLIITDDNPRFENALDIVNAILAGCKNSDKVTVLQNREQAIQHAISQAQAGDCVVIAGKGHEDYQEINGKPLPFSDSACVLNALKTRVE
jgi:UDP-N-acetylmuramoyl-L-alanyl-D-glutamate--2,6-diaminopimelate ligase